MADSVSASRLRELGDGFNTLLHRHMIASRHGICLVAEHHGRAVGYIAAATDTSAFYREFLRRRGIKAGLILLPRVLRPRLFAIILRGLTYFPESHAQDPAAELLSFAVHADMRSAGVGKELFRGLAHQLRARGVQAMKIITSGTDNEVANAFYTRMGCELLRSESFYADSRINVYAYRVQTT